MKYWTFLLAIGLIFGACNNQSGDKTKQVAADTTLRISVDESFQPVIEEEVKVFESSYPDTKVIVEYKPEAECLRDLQKDSTKIIIISRELSKEETKFFDQKIDYKPEFGQLAKDAIAVIVNAETPDSTFTIKELQQLLSGRGSNKLRVAIDGNTATSTVRYLKDSILGGGAFGKKVTGAKDSEDLITYISTTPNA
ncbi:MAG: PstS family phosphate ABC transporter substrate-binding protein, partial [Segetibacter sp.]